MGKAQLEREFFFHLKLLKKNRSFYAFNLKEKLCMGKAQLKRELFFYLKSLKKNRSLYTLNLKGNFDGINNKKILICLLICFLVHHPR